MTQAIDPVQFDTELFAIYQEHAKAEARLASLYNYSIHPMAGDRLQSNGWGQPKTWCLSGEHALEAVVFLRNQGDQRVPSVHKVPSEVIAEADQLDSLVTDLADQITALEYVYQQDPWTRWFPCLNADGHVHSSFRGCPTLNRGESDTRMGWATELSGTPIEVAVQMPPAGLGPRLCSVCFPEAPVEHCRSLRDITRGEREAEKARKAELRFVKNLRDSEMVFPDGSRFDDPYHGRVTTVAGCKDALRVEVEYRDDYGRGEHRNHAEAVKAAAHAARILLARGVPQTEIDKIIENAVKRNRKDGARI